MRSISKTTLRRIAVILLAILVVAATVFFVSTVWTHIEYQAARSLAVDAPIYGSTENDLVVIEKQYADRYPLWLVFAAGVQLVLVIVISIAILRWLYPNNRNPVPTKKHEVGDGDDGFDACLKVVEFNELKSLLGEFEWSAD